MELIVYIAVTHLFACLSPGPDIFLVVLNSLRHGWKTGVATTTGILSGVSIQITIGITGISYLLTRGEATRTAVALIGGVWLIYLGLKGLWHWRRENSSGKDPEVPTQPDLGFKSAWLQGFLVNLLNPKALLFFLGLFSVLLGPDVPVRIRILAGITMILVQFVAFSTVSIAVDRPAFKKGWTQTQIWLDRGISLILTTLGLWIWIDTLF